MAIHKNVSGDGKTVTIKISGRFDFSAHQEFRDAYSTVAANASRYVLDFANTEYVDSAACGMLLVFRDAAGGNGSDISIINASPDIQKTLNMLQFNKLFKIA
jgi:anti-anti-sigma factor